MRKILLKAMLVTLGVIAVSQIVSIAGRHAAGRPFTLFVFMMNSILPLMTALPASLVIFWQNAKLKRALADLSEAHAKLADRSAHDTMTGLLNREAFLEALSHARQSGDNGALLVIDVDYFKRVNDTFGHQAGDKALALIATAIRSSIRDEDIAGRIGGEEFCVFLPDTPRDHALHIAERIRSAVLATSFYPETSDRYQLTVSIGGVMTTSGQGLPNLMRRADVCLYEAKERGRNTIVFSEPETPCQAGKVSIAI